ncbi:MAG: hypothetical protein HKO01_03270 [Flaviramulus sp.]|nr:hypothetical protein [Flaviramulus sp.]NNC49536.1 hypothetical protein [Flaviramulus sp.]
MKKIIFTLVGISFLIFSCQNELLDLQESSIQSESFSSSPQSGVVECKVIDADRAPFGDRQPAANLWWSLNGGNDYFTTSTYFSSSEDHKLNFIEVDDNTARIIGSTINEKGCVVEVDVRLINKKNWDDWSTSTINGIPGNHKKEGTAGNASQSGDMNFYVIDSENSTLKATGTCGTGVESGKIYGLEQRPDPFTQSDNFGAHVGPGGANYDSNKGAIGLSTWGWIFDLDTKERLWKMDFNFLIDECKEIEEECKDCEGNVTELTLQYNGTEDAYIEVKTKDEGVNGSKIVFEGNVGPGGTFTIYGNDENGTFGDEIKVYVDGDYVKIKTDCSEDIGPGLILEDIEVISGKSTNGAYLCPKACDECEGKVNNLTLQYNGAEDANIRVETKKDGENGEKVVFEGMVEAGAEFSFVGNDKKGTLGTEITIYVNDVVNTKIHTSCSQPIGPGLMSGDFEVISGSSREGGDLCPVDTPPGSGDDCNECKGKVTRLDLTYNGTSDALVQVVQKKDNLIAFDSNVMAGDTFTFYGKDDKGTLGTEIIIYVNGFEAQRIHTSCSDPIGAGAVFGDFTVEGGASREGGELCPVDVPPTNTECECNGGIVSVTFTYSGDVNDLSSDDDDASFTDNGNGTVTLATFDGDKLSNPEIFVNGNNVGEIHASCSDNILGLSYGDLKVVEYVDKDGNVTSVDGCSQLPPGDDCSECDGKITRLDLQYNGSGSSIEITQKKDGQVVYDGSVSSGAEFTINGKDDKGTLGTEIIIKIDGVENQRIHTSCSVEIGAGSIFGDFAVLGGASRNGGELCPVEPDDTPPASTECDCDGKIVKMSVEYSGPNGATITVGDDEDGNNSKSWDNVQKGTILTAELGDIGNWWYWSVNGTVEAAIHTSCSDDILGNVNAHKSTFGNMGIYDDPEDDDENSRNDGTFLVTYHKDGKGNECSLDIAA